MKFIPARMSTYLTDAAWEDLPDELERQCCRGKSCGTVTVSKHLSAVVVDGRAVLQYSYIRDNEDAFYGPCPSVEELVTQMNATDRWPGVWVADTVEDALYCAVRHVEDAHLDGQTGSPHADYPLIDTYKESTVAESQTEFVVTPPKKWMGSVVINRTTGEISFRDQLQDPTDDQPGLASS